MVKEVHFSLFRSASGPCSRGGPAVSDLENEEPGTSAPRASSTSAKSFTYGPRSRRSSSVVDAGNDADELFALLQVAEGTGTSLRLLKLVTDVLENSVETSELQERLTSSTVGSQHMMPTGKLTVFHGLRPPPIGLQAYVERIAKYTKCSPVCFVMSLVYMDLLAQRDPDLLPTSLCVHRLLLTGVMLAAKLTDDHYFNNAFYGRVGGVSALEVNRLELEMLRLLDYRLHVSGEELRAVMKQLLAGSVVIGLGEGSWSSSSLRRKRRSVSGHSHSSEKRSSARRSSMESSVGAPSVSASATPSVTQSVYYDDEAEDDGGANEVMTALQAVTSPSGPRR